MVCRIYCAQTWDEALNRARVEASSELRKAENVFYPSTIRASDPPSTQNETTSITADPNPDCLKILLLLVNKDQPKRPALSKEYPQIRL